MRRGLLAFLAIACLLASAVDFQDSPEKASIHVAGHVFAINKKTSPSWGGSYIFSIDNEKSLRLGFYAGVEDEIFPNGKMQLLASRAPVKVQIAERTEHTLTVRAEYGLAPLDSPAKNSDYDALRMVYYLAFADNIPGIVVRARLIGQNRSVTVVNFNGSFGSDFVRYTITSGETIDYPEKSWSGIKGEYVIAERHDGTRMVITASTRLPARGFSWHGPANQWHKITLQPDEILDKLGIIGFVTDDAAIERLKSFQQSLPVPKEQTQVDSTTAMTAVPAQYLKDGFPETWPAPMVIRQGTGWVRPDTTDTWKSDNDLSFTATAAFDSDFLYIRADVTDNVFFQDRSNGSIWAGDCIQLAFDPLSEKSLSNIEFSFNASRPPFG
ncbi:MAG: hypothetical protein J6X55_17745 [Victivallales bacterium]|nr:hypothetical protein [Victivallales bacterium]